MQKTKKLWSLLLTMSILFSILIMPNTVLADAGQVIDLFNLEEGEGEGWYYDPSFNILHITGSSSDNPITITSNNKVVTDKSIKIDQDPENPNNGRRAIVLDKLTIDHEKTTNSYSPVEISTGNASFELKISPMGVRLIGGTREPAIFINNGYTTISSSDSKYLGSLYCQGGSYAAGIGTASQDLEDIVIRRISATVGGGNYGAGIGTGKGKHSINRISIYDSYIRAFGQMGGAAIGTGFGGGDIYSIFITNSEVIADAYTDGKLASIYQHELTCGASGIGSGAFVYDNTQPNPLPSVGTISILNAKATTRIIGGEGTYDGSAIGGGNTGVISLSGNFELISFDGPCIGSVGPACRTGNYRFMDGNFKANSIVGFENISLQGGSFDIGGDYKDNPDKFTSMSGGDYTEFVIGGFTPYSMVGDALGNAVIQSPGPGGLDVYGYNLKMTKADSKGEIHVYIPTHPYYGEPELCKIEYFYEGEILGVDYDVKGANHYFSSRVSDLTSGVSGFGGWYSDYNFTNPIGANGYVTVSGDMRIYGKNTEGTCNHMIGRYESDIPATCTSEGRIGRAYCIKCGMVFADTQIIPALGHDYVYTTIVEATCTSYGRSTDVCTRCGAEDPNALVDLANPLGHINVVKTPGYPATCTAEGMTDEIECSRCHIIRIPARVIPVNDNHNLVETISAIEPTCSHAGRTAQLYCYDCNQIVQKAVTIPMLQHTEVTIPGRNPTCTSIGWTEGRYCSECGITIKTSEEIAKLNHSMSAYVKVNSTTERSYCTNDGCSYYEERPISSANCEHTVKTAWSVVIPAGCETEGMESRTCVSCGATETRSTDPIGHSLGLLYVVTRPSCSTSGIDRRNCKREGCSYYKDSIIPALGHDMGEFVVTEPATCSVYGTEVSNCSRCTYSIRNQIDMVDHTEVIDPAVAATTTSTGLTQGSHCSVCNKVLVAQTTTSKLPSNDQTNPNVPGQNPNNGGNNTNNNPSNTPSNNTSGSGTTTPSTPTTPTTPSTTPSGNTSSNGTSSETGVAGFVERLYTIVLGRSSEPTGKAAWINQLVTHANTGAKAAEGFFYSPEFTNMGKSNEEWLTICYRTFFNRMPDQTGFNMWLEQLNNGTSREEVLSGFVNSAEWATVCWQYGIISGGNGTPNTSGPIPQNEITAFATRLYTTCLGREGDHDGLVGWSLALINGEVTGAQAAQGFFFSSELEAKGIDNGEFIVRLYKTFMGRVPDTDGYTAWLEQLNNGTSRQEVFNGFTGSSEWANLCAASGIAPV